MVGGRPVLVRLLPGSDSNRKGEIKMRRKVLISLLLGVFLILAGGLPGQADVVNFDSIPNTESVYNSITPGTGFGPHLVFTGVTFDGGVVMKDTTWEYLATTPPNLYATSNYIHLADGSSLPGIISATFDSLVSSVSLDIINGVGLSNADFTLSAYDTGSNLLSSFTLFGLASYLDHVVGHMVINQAGIKSIVVSSSQVYNNFGIDTVNYTPISGAPLPGAAWLLGSGLLGMVGLRRFRKS
jgi:hypothetical protein